ncbi:ras-specific guanine nucleotide-releasing factor 1 isoform X1 [Daphnia magna]|uniref:ras-specific guanine nucleotide-releasing factor 1 isoform X1 n=1 Tax=Daphnia magna TaxID=35525 RepID=UPI001E1BBC15|nr:ras-specific guanine nucleotide-releasing factor 1 isoform X1 [Daphnia magna]
MFSPKMQRPVRVNEVQLHTLGERARYDATIAGALYKRTSDGSKWQLRWFTLYQNVLFYWEAESSSRPSGVIFLEGSYCDRVISVSSAGHQQVNQHHQSSNQSGGGKTGSGGKYQHTTSSTGGGGGGNVGGSSIEKQYCFAITFRRDNQRSYELRAESESDCKAWIQAVKQASFNKLLAQKEELEQKHLHLLQIVESEKTAKWQYTRQCEELTDEIKQLRTEQLCTLKKEWRLTPSATGGSGGVGGATGGIGSSGGIGLGLGSSRQGADGSVHCGVGSTGTVELDDLKKIRKVQGFFRGWLCRHRWKVIVEEYIKSPHAESMRKRNSLVFRMLEDEEENVQQLEILVARFYRPFKMAASSKKPPCSHEDISSIFLNSETILFLHQIFYKGLQARMNNWPTLVLGDLFDVLLPMLNIYQEYVRNHHFSLQILTECKQNPQFSSVLSRLEEHSACKGRSLETFLTYPMHQIPRYIITLHEILAHTPHEHVERRSLENARVQLEHLSRQMHDEVSETENIRKCLAIERMIVEGCDILMDVTQVFVRQGSLLHIVKEKARSQKGRLSLSSRRGSVGTLGGERGEVRQCFLFSNTLIIATRTSDGKLHLLPEIGKIPFVDATLIEDPTETSSCDDDDESLCSTSSQTSSEMSDSSATADRSKQQSGNNYHGLDFQLIVENKTGNGPGKVVHLVAPSMQDKAAWISDISQCIDNVHFNDFVHSSISDASSVTHPHSVRNDPRLFNDDIDIRFSRTLNSCKVPQIRYATPERLLERLTDLRFLSIDFLNTFLLTYRVFTDGVTVLDALKKVFYASSTVEPAQHDNARCSISSIEFGGVPCQLDQSVLYPTYKSVLGSPARRISGGSGVLGSPKASPRNSPFTSPRGSNQWSSRPSVGDVSVSRRGSRFDGVEIRETPNEEEAETEKSSANTGPSQSGPGTKERSKQQHLTIPKKGMELSSSAETLSENNCSSSTSTLVALSSSTQTLTSFSVSGANDGNAPSIATTNVVSGHSYLQPDQHGSKPSHEYQLEIPTAVTSHPVPSFSTSSHQATISRRESMITGPSLDMEVMDDLLMSEPRPGNQSSGYSGVGSGRSGSSAGQHPPHPSQQQRVSIGSSYYGAGSRYGDGTTSTVTSSARQSTSYSTQSDNIRVGAGVVVTSHRQSQRRSSTSSAAAAFAVATAGSSNPRDYSLPAGTTRTGPGSVGVGGGSVGAGGTRSQTYCSINLPSTDPRGSFGGPVQQQPSGGESGGGGTGGLGPTGGQVGRDRKESIMSSAATMRVLSVLRHWISKHRDDFESSTSGDLRLKNLTIEFLEDVLSSPQLLPAEHKAASQLLQLLTRDDPSHTKIDLGILLAQPVIQSRENIETLSALEIAEQMTVLDHAILASIKSEELLGQAWMKPDKLFRAPHIILITKRFNEVSRLVASEVIRRPNLAARIAVIEKWTAVADICRCLHNFNGVLQICSAFTNSGVFRLKKTWEKLSKTTRQTIDKLQSIVSTDGRFRNLRDALHRCDPPCIPYLGMYLTDLSFIEEGTPDFTEDGLLNFSKMRMVAHVIREIRHFQSTSYKIEHSSKVNSYLLDVNNLVDDEDLYQMSLEIEPRTSRLGSISHQVGSCLLSTLSSAAVVSTTGGTGSPTQ